MIQLKPALSPAVKLLICSPQKFSQRLKDVYFHSHHFVYVVCHIDREILSHIPH